MAHEPGRDKLTMPTTTAAAFPWLHHEVKFANFRGTLHFNQRNHRSPCLGSIFQRVKVQELWEAGLRLLNIYHWHFVIWVLAVAACFFHCVSVPSDLTAESQKMANNRWADDEVKALLRRRYPAGIGHGGPKHEDHQPDLCNPPRRCR